MSKVVIEVLELPKDSVVITNTALNTYKEYYETEGAKQYEELKALVKGAVDAYEISNTDGPINEHMEKLRLLFYPPT